MNYQLPHTKTLLVLEQRTTTMHTFIQPSRRIRLRLGKKIKYPTMNAHSKSHISIHYQPTTHYQRLPIPAKSIGQDSAN